MISILSSFALTCLTKKLLPCLALHICSSKRYSSDSSSGGSSSSRSSSKEANAIIRNSILSQLPALSIIDKFIRLKATTDNDDDDDDNDVISITGLGESAYTILDTIYTRLRNDDDDNNRKFFNFLFSFSGDIEELVATSYTEKSSSYLDIIGNICKYELPIIDVSLSSYEIMSRLSSSSSLSVSTRNSTAVDTLFQSFMSFNHPTPFKKKKKMNISYGIPGNIKSFGQQNVDVINLLSMSFLKQLQDTNTDILSCVWNIGNTTATSVEPLETDKVTMSTEEIDQILRQQQRQVSLKSVVDGQTFNQRWTTLFALVKSEREAPLSNEDEVLLRTLCMNIGRGDIVGTFAFATGPEHAAADSVLDASLVSQQLDDTDATRNVALAVMSSSYNVWTIVKSNIMEFSARDGKDFTYIDRSILRDKVSVLQDAVNTILRQQQRQVSLKSVVDGQTFNQRWTTLFTFNACSETILLSKKDLLDDSIFAQELSDAEVSRNIALAVLSSSHNAATRIKANTMEFHGRDYADFKYIVRACKDRVCFVEKAILNLLKMHYTERYSIVERQKYLMPLLVDLSSSKISESVESEETVLVKSRAESALVTSNNLSFEDGTKDHTTTTTTSSSSSSNDNTNMNDNTTTTTTITTFSTTSATSSSTTTSTTTTNANANTNTNAFRSVGC